MLKMSKSKITFYGGVGSATGANIGLQCGELKIMVDCGLLQGSREIEGKNFSAFPYNPNSFHFLGVTHAHMDHIGKIPKLVREGFSGEIISTNETKEIAEPVLLDGIKVMSARHGKALYKEEDVKKTMSLWRGYKYKEEIDLSGIKMIMTNAGHILGSAILNINCGGGGVVSFTGDLGNSPSPLLPDAEPILNSDYIVMESVYGDRNHEDKNDRDQKFKEILREGIERRGTIVIPAFSVERTQIILFELNNLIERNEIQRVPVFLDSPLAEKVTNIYKKYSNDFKESVREQMKKDDIFDFPNLRVTKNNFESDAIEKTVGPKIILAGSGMSEGGRVLNHESKILNHAGNTLILVGYQPVGTLGRKLEEGVKKIEIRNPPAGGGKMERLKINAKIEKIEGYSSHMDSEHLLEFVSKIKNPKKIFCIMGEPKSSLFLVQRIRDYLGANAVYPEPHPREYALI